MSFLSYISLRKEEGDEDYKDIVVKTAKSEKNNIEDLHKLTVEQIRQISESLYNDRYGK